MKNENAKIKYSWTPHDNWKQHHLDIKVLDGPHKEYLTNYYMEHSNRYSHRGCNSVEFIAPEDIICNDSYSCCYLGITCSFFHQDKGNIGFEIDPEINVPTLIPYFTESIIVKRIAK